MCWKLINFASLFEYGFGLILAAGIIQEIYLKRIFSIDSLRAELERIKAAVALNPDQLDEVESFEATLEGRTIVAGRKMQTSLEVGRVVLGLGLLLPISFATVVAFDASSIKEQSRCDPGVSIAIPVMLSILWGPIAAATFALYSHSICRPLIDDLSAKISAVLGNDIA